jgi:hypothetical protein
MNDKMVNSGVEEGITRHVHLWGMIIGLLSRQASSSVTGYQALRIEADEVHDDEAVRIISRYVDSNGQVFEFTETVTLSFMYTVVTDD